MSYLHRVTPNKATSQNIEAIYNEKGQMLDANTKEVLVQGQIDKGHKHGYEEQAMCDIHTTDSFDLCYSDNITDWKCKYNIRGEWRFQVRKSANKLYHFIYKTQEGHKQPIAGMEFSPDKKQLLTTAYDRSVKIWDLSDASRDQYNISPHCLYSIEFIPGLKVKGAVIQNLHSSSNLTDKELESLKTYGAIL